MAWVNPFSPGGAFRRKKPAKPTPYTSPFVPFGGFSSLLSPTEGLKPKEKEPVLQTGTAAPGKTPNFRTTAQGDKFDINKPLIASKFKSNESFRQAVKIKGTAGFGGFTEAGLPGQPGMGSREEQERIKKVQALIAGGATPEEALGIPTSEIGAAIAETPILGDILGWAPETGLEAAAAGLGMAAIPIMLSVGAGISIPVSKAAIATNIAKTTLTTSTSAGIASSGILAKVTSGALVKLAIAGAAVGLIESKIGKIDSALSQVRESLDAPVQNVRVGAWTPEEGLAELDALEAQINEYERAAKTTGIFSIRARFFGGLLPLEQRIRKLRVILEGKRTAIMLLVENPPSPEVQQMAILINEMKGGE